MSSTEGIRYLYSAQNIPSALKSKFKMQAVNSFRDMAKFLSNEEMAVILIGNDFFFSQQITDYKKLSEIQKKYTSLVFYDDKVPSVVFESALGNFIVDKILSSNMQESILVQHLQDITSVLKQRREMNAITSQVRAQNRTLQELNDNLESIVAQRTQYLEISTHEIETKNRDVKDLIKFIKAVSSVNGLEDLLLILRQEFLKYHRLNSPLLIYSLRKGSFRILYFQGPQIIDSPVSFDESIFKTKNQIELRKQLAVLLSRPVSAIACTFLSNTIGQGIIVFEHNMDFLEQKIFSELLLQRTDSLRVAFDRLLFKMKSHEISKQWSTTFDHLQDPIVILDDEYGVIRSNKLFSNNVEEPCYKAFAHRESPCFGCPVLEARSKKNAQQGKITAQGKMYQVNAYPIYLDSQEKFYNMIVHYTDITRSVNLQSQLVQSEKMSALGLLAGNIAHELNNPLTGIKSLTQLLIQESSSEIQQDLVEIKLAAERSEQIIKNLLDFSSSSPTGEVYPVSARELILKTLPFLKSSMRYQNSRIDLSEEEDFIMAEPHLLQQVIFNLVNNACQAMGETGDLTLQTLVTETSVEIRVRDTGPGVPQDLREVIFTPFFTTKDEGEGTGLGLSLGRTIVARFGGVLSLRDDLQVGSEFIIQLPKVKK